MSKSTPVTLLLALAGLVFSTSLTTVGAVEFPNAPKRQAPRSTAAGGRRGGASLCIQGGLPMKALTPGDDNYFTTVSPQTPFFVYIPKTQARLVRFLLKDGSGTEIDSQEIPIQQGDYVLRINPSRDAILDEGQSYNWEVSLVCPAPSPNGGSPTTIRGSVERVSPDWQLLETLMGETDTIKRAQIYANANLWGDTIALVSQVRKSQPREWVELLNSVGLRLYANKPIISSKPVTR